MKFIVFSFFISILTSLTASATSYRTDGLTPLHVAAAQGDLSTVKKLLNKGENLFALDAKMGVSVLHKAVYSGNADEVNFLLNHGAFINLQSPSNGNTPLHDAIYFKQGHDVGVIRVLLAHHPSLTVKNRAGLTVLDAAKILNDPSIIRLLENYINAEETPLGRQLMKAVKANQAEAVQRLLDKNPHTIDLEETDDQGFTPLLWASRQGYTAIVKLLLEKGANPNHEDQWMHANAGHKAAFWGHADVITLLIQHGLDINAQGGYNGYTALHDAVSQGHIDAIKVLLKNNANTTIRGHDGKTPVDIAKLSENQKLLSLLTPTT